jgi:ABC-type Co2+ transport system permease subunit
VALSNIDPELLRHADGHAPAAEGQDSISKFATIVLALGSVGWIIEAAITGSVVKFISQVKPELLYHMHHRAGGK